MHHRRAEGILVAAVILLNVQVFGQRTAVLPPDTLAEVGASVITARDFLERIELMPWPGKDRAAEHDSAKIRALRSLVAEFLLAQEAAVRGLGRDSGTERRRLELEGLMVRDELYKREVLNRVSVAPEEISLGLRRYPRELEILFLRAPARAAAEELRDSLEMYGTVDSTLRRVSSRLLIGADTLFLQFGSMDRTMEDTAYALSSRRPVSGVLRSDLYGWGLVARLGERTHADAIKKSIPDRRTAVESIIRRRKQDARAASFTGSILAPQRAEADPALFETAAATLHGLVMRDPATRASKGVYRIFVTDLDTVEHVLEKDLQRAFVRTASGELTVADVLDGLRSRDMGFASLDPERFRNRLNAYIRDVVAGKLIAREGYRLGLERSENVRRDVAVWERTWAATTLIKDLTASIEVTEADAMEYCLRNGAVLGRPYEVNIREVLSDSLAGSLQVLERMNNGEDLAHLAREMSARKEWREKGGESGYFNVGVRPALGFAALWTDSGSIGGPVKLPEGFSLFQVLGKRAAVRDSIPSPDSLKVLARRAARAEHQHRVVEKFVSRLAKESGVKIHYDRLLKLHVNPANMVTRRFIGFGGVITAVPSITPIWQWEGEQPDVVP
ncbi:MAG: hypothetical protein H6Q32_1164 [Bacteroidetes bacterium]|nr:hypothetical protein [Bacteroidota bacterium]